MICVEDDISTFCMGKLIHCVHKECQKNKENRKDNIFWFRVCLGIFFWDVPELIFVVELINFQALYLILTAVFAEVIFFVIITIRRFRLQRKIFILGYVFTFKVLSLYSDIIMFNSNTAKFDMKYYKNLYHNVTNLEDGSLVSVATCSVVNMGLDFIELLAQSCAIGYIYYTTPNSFKDIFCLSGEEGCSAESEDEPEDVIQDAINHV